MFKRALDFLDRSKLGIAICAISAAIIIYNFQTTIHIGQASLHIKRAVSDSARQQGLLGLDSLDEVEGMLFVFNEAGQYHFHMVGMKFPLDFIWISADGTIVDITPDVQPQLANVPNDKIKLYSPIVPVKYVLEVNAGWVQRHNIRVGMQVSHL